MGSKISIINHINAVRSFLKKEEMEDLIEDSIKTPTEDSHAMPSPGNSETLETFISPFTGIKFVRVPAGEFNMGSSSEELEGSDFKFLSFEYPSHKVTIKNPFYISKFPVTQKQWKSIMGNNPSHFKGESNPVEKVSWKDVQEFIERLNEAENTDKYRLPSEAEWEYACRGGTQTRYYFSNDQARFNEYAWCVENSDRKTHPVGRKKPNSWGLYDMNGNVWEWVQDKWHDNYDGAPSDGSSWEGGNSSLRVSRGGSWYCDVDSCRSASRFGRDTENRFGNLGFRLVREF